MSNRDDIFQELYTEGFLTIRGERYGFDPAQNPARHLLKRAAQSLQRDHQSTPFREEARERVKAHKKSLTLLGRLEASLGDDLEAGGYVLLSEVFSQYFPKLDINNSNPLSAVAPEDRLVRFSLDRLRDYLNGQISRYSQPGGRPSKRHLQDYAHCMHQLWVDELGQPFTLDYHKGIGLTPAFMFLKDMLPPSITVTDTELITAARHIIAKQSAHKN
jgi:hypothetical protein